MSKRRIERRFKLPHILPDIKDWPIHKFYEKRKDFIQEATQEVVENILAKDPEVVNDIITKSLYMERSRVKGSTWRVDPPDARSFWKKIRNQHAALDSRKNAEESLSVNKDILEQVVERYLEEIAGNFKEPTFKFARKFLYALFARLLNAAGNKHLFRITKRKQLYQRLKTEGHIEELRELCKDHTVILVPTHFSNLDSILIGYAVDLIGVPAFAYGAGLNLFNSGATAYYMNRLGAYRVDRRKKNPIYLETLKTFSQVTIEKGVHSLFFPGGTRSRNGSVESNLKLGLLSTVIAAQREHIKDGNDKKIVVVPLILGYHFVLEAKQLIHQYLKSAGREKYNVKSNKKFGFRKTVKYLWQFFTKSSEIYLNFGEPIDVLGNKVNIKGESIDPKGNQVFVKDYFLNDGEVTKDLQRENEYTKNLASHIVDSYHKENVILSSHLVAFTAFHILLYQNKDLDLYGVLKLPTDEYWIKTDVFAKAIADVKAKLYLLQNDEKLILSQEVDLTPLELVDDGVNKLGIYHEQLPLTYADKQKEYLNSEALDVLYYYSNRLDGYDLENMLDWSQYAFELK